jgi:hypothetical protein
LKSAEYRLKDWVSINLIFPLPLTDWLYMDNVLRRAICDEVEEVIKQRNAEAMEREAKLKTTLETMKAKSSMTSSKLLDSFFK